MYDIGFILPYIAEFIMLQFYRDQIHFSVESRKIPSE